MGDEHHELDLPPAPATRHITPAPEDFENLPPLLKYLWPIGWIVLCVLIWVSFSNAGWHATHGEGHGEGHGAAPVEGHAHD